VAVGHCEHKRLHQQSYEKYRSSFDCQPSNLCTHKSLLRQRIHRFEVTIYTVLDINFPVISGVLIKVLLESKFKISDEIFSEIDALGEQICVVNSHFCGFSFGLILLGHFGWPTIHYQPQPLVLQCHKTPSDNGRYSYRALRLQYKTVGIVHHSE
jgi:hypothetical protein